MATGYKDAEVQLDVKGEVAPIDVVLKQKKEKTIKYREGRTRTRINVRNGHYIALSGEMYDDKNDYCDYGAKLEYSYIRHFGGIFEFRPGLSIGGITYKAEEDKMLGFVEVPLQLGVGFPFGKNNAHLFSLLAGGYVRYYLDEEASDSESDFGLRFSAQLDFSRFVIGVEFSQNLYLGDSYPGIKLGWKFFRK